MENGGLALRGDYELFLNIDGVETVMEIKNIIVNQGLAYVLGLICGNTSNNLYVVPTANPYTAGATDTLASVLSAAGEVTAYSAASRPQCNLVVTNSTGPITADNSAQMATLTFTGSGTVNGIIICNQSTKSSSSGTALSYVALPAAFTFVNNASLGIKYTITAASV